MEAQIQDSVLFREYAELVRAVQQTLWEAESAESWQQRYAGYMQAMQENLPRATAARRAFPRDIRPFHCYTKIGTLNKNPCDFDLRFLGQSVGTLKARGGKALLMVDADRAKANREYFRCRMGDFEDDWTHGEEASSFRDYFESLVREDKLLKPQLPEHMVESALFTELEKEAGATKELTGIQPVIVEDLLGTRFHMKTALSASNAEEGRLPEVSADGGEIDIFCRWRRGNQSRLTVIELKKDRKQFQNVLRQAIAYAVFIRELARSPSGSDWMKFWRPRNRPWQGESFTINAVAAMPMPKRKQDLSFAGMRLPVEGGGPTDFIELHWLGLTGADPESWGAGREGHTGKAAEPVRFVTSLGTSKSSPRG